MSRKPFYSFKSSYVLAVVLALSAGQLMVSDLVSADETSSLEIPVSVMTEPSVEPVVVETTSSVAGNSLPSDSAITQVDNNQASTHSLESSPSNNPVMAASAPLADNSNDQLTRNLVIKTEPNLAVGADASQDSETQTMAPITRDDYRRASASQMSQWIKSGRVTGDQLLDYAFETIKETNPELNNIISTREAEARQELANLADEGQPFYKVPIVVKGLGHTVAGGQNTQGFTFLSDQTSRSTGSFVKQLQKLGFVVIGQSSFPQLGLINVTNSDLYGTTHNPWNLAHNPGGSSGGASAAVSSGQVAIASASDGGGSTRIPASWSGLVGLHPTRGILEGNSPSLKNQVSHFAVTKTVEDTKTLFEALLKTKAKEEQTSAILSTNQVIAYTTKTPAGTPISPEAVKAVEEAVDFLNKQGYQTVEVDYPIDGKRMMMDYYTIAAAGTAIADYLINQKLKRHLTADDVELLTWALYQTSQSLTRDDVDAAWADVAILTEELNTFYSQYPIFLTPTTAYAAPEAGYHHIPEDLKEKMRDMSALSKEEQLELIYQQWLPAWTLTPFTQLANLTGTPSLTLPTHLTKDGLPMGVLFNSSANQDRLLLQIGELFESQRALTTYTSQEEIEETTEIPYAIQYIQTDALPLGYKELLQDGKAGKKQLIYHLLKQGLSLVEARLVGESLLVNPQHLIYLIGTRKMDRQSISQNSLSPQRHTFGKVVDKKGQRRAFKALSTASVTKAVQKADGGTEKGVLAHALPATGDKSDWSSSVASLLGLSSLMIGLAKLKKRLFHE